MALACQCGNECPLFSNPPFRHLGKFFWQSRLMRVSESCDPSIPPEEFLRPPGPKLETELKMSSWGLLAPGSQKVKNRVEKSQKVEVLTLFPLFDSFSTLFLTFWGPEAGRPRELIFNSVSNFEPGGPKTSSGGMEGSQSESSLSIAPRDPNRCAFDLASCKHCAPA